MKSNYIIRAIAFIHAIQPYLRRYRRVEVAVREFNTQHHRAVKFAHGAVRNALITSDYVIKWDYDAANRRLFGGCREEMKLYKRAKQDGYAYLFAEITEYEYHGRKFYIMPRVKIAEDLGLWDIDNELDDDERNYLYDELNLGDLHSENWGMKNGCVVIIDYACAGYKSA